MKTLWKETLGVWFFGLTKVPMIFKHRPRVVTLNPQETEIIIPYKRKTCNHIKSLYFGSLAVGADLAVGLLAQYHIKTSKENVILIFKDFKIDFLKTARADTHFICRDGSKISDLIASAVSSGTRQNLTCSGFAICPKLNTSEVVAEFQLTLSVVKRKKS